MSKKKLWLTLALASSTAAGTPAFANHALNGMFNGNVNGNGNAYGLCWMPEDFPGMGWAGTDIIRRCPAVG